MVLVVVVVGETDFDFDSDFGFDELPFVHLRIAIIIYEVRGIRDASTCQL